MTKEELLKNFDIDFANDSMGEIFTKFDNFLGNVKYPKKPHEPQLSSFKPSVEDIENYQKQLDEYSSLLESYKEAKKIYDEVSNTIDSIKEEMIRVDSGLNNIPEQYREKVYNIAWRNGHSWGYTSVYNHLCELVEIFN